MIDFILTGLSIGFVLGTFFGMCIMGYVMDRLYTPKYIPTIELPQERLDKLPS